MRSNIGNELQTFLVIFVYLFTRRTRTQALRVQHQDSERRSQVRRALRVVVRRPLHVSYAKRRRPNWAFCSVPVVQFAFLQICGEQTGPFQESVWQAPFEHGVFMSRIFAFLNRLRRFQFRIDRLLANCMTPPKRLHATVIELLFE